MNRRTGWLGLKSSLLVAALAAGCSAEGTAPGGGAAEGGVKEEALGGVVGLPELLRIAKGAGLPCDALVVAGAVAMGESEGVADAVHYNGATQDCPNGSVDRGIWQINDCYWPDVTDACAFDPACNAGAMARISGNGASWQPWLAYINGSYAAYLDDAETAYAQGVPGCSGGGGPADPGGGAARCDELGYEGACVGEVSVWSDGGACRVRDCGAEGRTCDWISADVGWGCTGGTAGATTVDCGSLGYTGRCMSETLVWAEDGRCNAVYCPSSGRSCLWDGESGYNCK